MYDNEIVIKHLKKQKEEFINTYGVANIDKNHDLLLRRWELERRIQLAEDIDYLNELKRELEIGLKKKKLTCEIVVTPPIFDGPLQEKAYIEIDLGDGKKFLTQITQDQYDKLFTK